MNSHDNTDHRLGLAKQILLDLIHGLLRDGHSGVSAPENLYQFALSSLIMGLLQPIDGPKHPLKTTKRSLENNFHCDIARELGPLSPEDVGQIYEYLRGLRLEMMPGDQPSLVQCAGGKRNQGLFYTPKHIIDGIVASTLDELEISEPEEYLDLKILDPAVGTGVFLSRALEEIAQRVLSRSDNINSCKIQSIYFKIRDALSSDGRETKLEWKDAVRMHIMATCLYGVDLDPIAVRIARAVLIKRVFSKFTPVGGIEPNIVVGNSLIGAPRSNTDACTKTEMDLQHARAYFKKHDLDSEALRHWSEEKGVFHWPLQFPEVFSVDRGGFDAVIGNPPYEIISVKESGMGERSKEQAYFRQMYRTCQGKINTYRLMMERGLNLLRESAALGFIVPATLLADSTAEKLRRMILDEFRVSRAIIIPEKAQAFEGVTQAFLILIIRKAGGTSRLGTVMWDGKGLMPHSHGMEISRSIIEGAGFRVPLIRSVNERNLLEALMRIPPLRGDKNWPAIGRVHQGEINLTVHREFITTRPSGRPLIRGEHVVPLRVIHPSPSGQRLDWMLPAFLERYNQRYSLPERHGKESIDRRQVKSRGRPWEKERIVIGRVVNMDTHRRLKAASVASGAFLGDMTNFIAETNAPTDYLLGLLNSRLLNWRLRITSTNNYLSAAEIEALPIPRISMNAATEDVVRRVHREFEKLLSQMDLPILKCVDTVKRLLESAGKYEAQTLLAMMIQWTVQKIRDRLGPGRPQETLNAGAWNLLDATVLLLYGVDSFSSVFDEHVIGGRS